MRRMAQPGRMVGMTATAIEPAATTAAPPAGPTFEEIRFAVRRLTPEQREDLREELAFQERIESPEFIHKISEISDRIEAGNVQWHTLEELEQRWAELDAAGA